MTKKTKKTKTQTLIHKFLIAEAKHQWNKAKKLYQKITKKSLKHKKTTVIK